MLSKKFQKFILAAPVAEWLRGLISLVCLICDHPSAMSGSGPTWGTCKTSQVLLVSVPGSFFSWGSQIKPQELIGLSCMS